jgi:glycosyltransferase involved in cell wall biosynthesis
MRTGILSQYLEKAGHEVTWINARFEHSSKTFRKVKEEDLQLSPKLQIKLLNSSGYKKNVSLKRLVVDHTQLAEDFKKLAKTLEVPDVILTSYPTLGLSVAAIKFGKANEVPVIVDVRDLWPNAFLDSFPVILRSIAKVALWPMYSKSKYIFNNASGVTAIAQPFLDWALRTSDASLASKPNAVFSFGYERITSTKDAPIQKSVLDATTGSNADAQITFCYIGNISHNLDLKPVAEAMRLLRKQNVNTSFICCGRGVAFEEVKTLFEGIENVHFPGFINASEIAHVMDFCDFGIVPYVNTPNFQYTISNKVVEYLAGQLPILTSIEGYMGPFLRIHGCGLVYDNSRTLAKHIELLTNNESEKQLMKKNALSLFQSQFKASSVYGDFVHYLEGFAEAQS